MKKLGLVLVLMAGMAFIHQNVHSQSRLENQQKQESTQTIRPGYVDNNGDGICDHYDGTQAGQGLGPGNGYGKGRNNGQGLNRNFRNNFIKGNGNGLRDGSGRRNNGRRFGSVNFIDANGNGICDRIENQTELQ